MDWLRRNWPDLLIGVALVAVIAGIIATLISGGSFFPVGQGERTTGPDAGTTPSQSGPATLPDTGASTGVTPLPGEGQTGTPSGTARPDATDVAGPDDLTSGEAGAAADDGPGIAVLPPTGSSDTTSSDAAPADAGTTTTDPAQGTTGAATGTVTPLAPNAPSTGNATSGATSPAATTPAATSPATPPRPASAGSEEASYRVSVGAFGNADNAQRLAQTFQAAGFPVLLGTQGNLTIVLVGPYATEAEARRVADQVRAGDFDVVDPTVYLYEPEPGDGASAGVAPTTGATPAAPAASTPATSPTPATTSTPAATAGQGRYLQVGAYANLESSLPQRERLEGLGFTVTDRTEGELIKLLVGPFQGSDLSAAQSRLAAEGIENFAR